MIKGFGGIVLSFFMLVSTAHSAAVCFGTVREWEAVRAQLPRFMQNGELYAVHKSLLMKGAVRIVQKGAVFEIEAQGRHAFAGSLHQSGELKQLCVDGKKMTATLADGRWDNFTITKDGLKAYGFTFKPTTSAAYFDMVSRLSR